MNSSDELKHVTFRKSGKAHRGVIFPARDGRREYLAASCHCPGSQNGRLTNGAAVICEGWDKANCGH